VARVNCRHAVAAVLPLLWPQVSAARPPVSWEIPIAEASARFGIPMPWIRRVIHAESAGRTMLKGRPIRSRVGAMGLMQLMPGTWLAMRHAHGLGYDPDDPRDNILAGTAYLRAMYDRFGYPGLFAAYNAGPARYAEHLARGRRLPAETIAYVAKVAGGAPPFLKRYQVGPLPAHGGQILGPRPRYPPVAGGGEEGARDTPGVFFRLGGLPSR
jgi:soluble lytic murein transglycosylase-like protein